MLDEGHDNRMMSTLISPFLGQWKVEVMGHEHWALRTRRSLHDGKAIPINREIINKWRLSRSQQ